MSHQRYRDASKFLRIVIRRRSLALRVPDGWLAGGVYVRRLACAWSGRVLDRTSAGVERRRYSVEKELRLVEASNRSGTSVSQVARIHRVSPRLLFHWRRRVAVGASEVRDLKWRVREL